MNDCKLCEKRRPRRFCPGVAGDICPLCCGQEREVSVACPFDCAHLREARRFEKLPEISEGGIPHEDISISEDFLDRNSPLIAAISAQVLHAAMETPSSRDSDAAEALDSMVRTYRTRESGLYYESRPANLLAGAIQQNVTARLEALRERIAERTGAHSIRDKDVLGVLVFLRRLEVQYDNGRPLGRAFLHFLWETLRPAAEEPEPRLVIAP